MRSNPALREFALKALFVTVVTPFILYGAIGLAITAFGGDFNWQKSWDDVAVGVAFGVAGGVTVGVIATVEIGVLLGVFVSVAYGVSRGLARGAWAIIPVVVTFGIVVGVGATRLPIYIFELLPAILAYRRCIRTKQFEQELRRSPIYFDEFIFFPQPYLSAILLNLLEQDLNAGLKNTAFIATHPYQNWAAQKALNKLLAQDRIPFFFILDRLLSSPPPYDPIVFDRGNLWRASFRYYSVRSILGEIAGISPRSSRGHQFGRNLTFTLGLRTRETSLYAPYAGVYLKLLNAYWHSIDNITPEEDIAASAIIENYLLDNAVDQFEDGADLPHGKDFYQSLRLITDSLHCESLQDVAKLRDDFNPLFEIDDPLRPQIMTAFRRLHDAAIDAASFLTGEYEGTRDRALLGAQGVLEEARKLTNEVYEPERSLLLAAIEHWRRMFAVEGGRVAQGLEIIELPNPYIAGRPIHPSDGRLFVGRRDEFRQIEENLSKGLGVVIWGQRRIGKSSILLHLRERLPHSLLPVYLNLQLLMANTTGGFLRAVGGEAVKQLQGKLSPLPTLPSAEEFAREPFLCFTQLLDEIERSLAPGQRVLLSFDEFEELEKSVKDGKVEERVFTYLRGVTQTGRGFSMLFAGLHTLEEMTRDYWNPFFQSVQTIRIGYLSELDSRQLITDPIDQFPLGYDEEAINRIAHLTLSHPYLAQSVCHNLVNRLNDPLYRSNRAKLEDVDAVLNRTLESSGYYFDDYVWGWSNADERLALSLIAEDKSDWADFALVEKHLGREAALNATRNLVARDILTERTQSGALVFRFCIPLSRMWVLRTKSSARIQLEGGSR